MTTDCLLNKQSGNRIYLIIYCNVDVRSTLFDSLARDSFGLYFPQCMAVLLDVNSLIDALTGYFQTLL